MSDITNNINTEILRQCREQIGLDILEVKGKVRTIEKIEEEKKNLPLIS